MSPDTEVCNITFLPPSHSFGTLSLSLAIIFLLSSTNALAGIHINSSVLIKTVDQEHLEVSVFNDDKEQPAYVEVYVEVVKNPGADNETRSIVGDANEIEFIVSPNRLVVPPEGRKSVRMIQLTPVIESDRVYRVTFKPVIGKVSSDVTAIKILIAYQALIIIRPDEPRVDLAFERQGSRVTFVNKGNTVASLKQFHQCGEFVAKKMDYKDAPCEKYNGKRIYAGQSWTLDLNNDLPLYFLEEQLERTVLHELR